VNQYKKSAGAFVCLLIIIFTGCNIDQHIPPEEIEMTEEDELFIAEATHVNLVGIEYGQLANTRSETGMILAYANRVIEEHTAAAVTLEAIARDAEIATPEVVHQEWQANRDQLSEMRGEEFDSLYIQRKIETYLYAQDIMEQHINTSNVEVLTDYARQQLLQINLRLDDALLIQSELQ